MLKADIESRQQSLDSCNAEVQKLVLASPTASLQPLKAKLSDVNERYKRIAGNCQSWGEALETTSHLHDQFSGGAEKISVWIHETGEKLAAPELSKMDLDAFAVVIEQSLSEANQAERELLALRKTYDDLLSVPNAIETSPIREQMKDVDGKWARLENQLNDRDRQLKDRRGKLDAYERQKAEVLHWLDDMKQKEDALAPVALHTGIVKKQLEELKPLISAHAVFKPEVDTVERLGQQCIGSTESQQSAADLKSNFW